MVVPDTGMVFLAPWRGCNHPSPSKWSQKVLVKCSPLGHCTTSKKQVLWNVHLVQGIVWSQPQLTVTRFIEASLCLTSLYGRLCVTLPFPGNKQIVATYPKWLLTTDQSENSSKFNLVKPVHFLGFLKEHKWRITYRNVGDNEWHQCKVSPIMSDDLVETALCSCSFN